MLNLHLIAIFKKPAKSPFYLYSFNKLVYSKLQILELQQPDLHHNRQRCDQHRRICLPRLQQFEKDSLLCSERSPSEF